MITFRTTLVQMSVLGFGKLFEMLINLCYLTTTNSTLQDVIVILE